MISAVLWDVDGTLVDPASAITGGMADALEAHGYRRPSEAEMQKFVGPPVNFSLTHFTEVPHERFGEVISTYRDFYRGQGIARSRLYPGLRSLLEGLHGEGIAMAVASQKPLYLVHEVLDHFGLTQFFTVLAGAPDELGSGDQSLPADKPGIIAYAVDHLEEKTGQQLDRGRSVMVGDRLYDGRGAALNGIASIGVGWGFGGADELSAEFDDVVGSPQELEIEIRRCLAGKSRVG